VEKIDVKKSFGVSVRACRGRLGLSQEKLAERADLHRTYISDVERGARNLSLESIAKLAHALEVSVAALFPLELQKELQVENPNGTEAHGKSREVVEVLLVEDNPEDAELALYAFKQARFANRVQVVSDGQQALDHFFAPGKDTSRLPGQCPQIVLLDLNLPKVSGMEVLRRLKGDDRTRMIPVIVLTISQMFNDFNECERLGAETYLIKPVSFQKLSQLTPRLQLDWMLLKPAEPKSRKAIS
jgi:CheY-like chemotaxis protein/DNA-binding XRE family transcriptional regulator